MAEKQLLKKFTFSTTQSCNLTVLAQILDQLPVELNLLLMWITSTTLTFVIFSSDSEQSMQDQMCLMVQLR